VVGVRGKAVLVRDLRRRMGEKEDRRASWTCMAGRKGKGRRETGDGRRETGREGVDRDLGWGLRDSVEGASAVMFSGRLKAMQSWSVNEKSCIRPC